MVIFYQKYLETVYNIQINDIKCSNCIDLNNKKYININCTLFSNIKINPDSLNTKKKNNEQTLIDLKNLEDLQKLLYNGIILCQSYGSEFIKTIALFLSLTHNLTAKTNFIFFLIHMKKKI